MWPVGCDSLACGTKLLNFATGFAITLKTPQKRPPTPQKSYAKFRNPFTTRKTLDKTLPPCLSPQKCSGKDGYLKIIAGRIFIFLQILYAKFRSLRHLLKHPPCPPNFFHIFQIAFFLTITRINLAAMSSSRSDVVTLCVHACVRPSHFPPLFAQ